MWVGRKTFEIRKDDRGFVKGDILHLREASYNGLDAGKSMDYTGREMIVKVTHKLKGYGLKDGWCLLSIEKIDQSGSGY